MCLRMRSSISGVLPRNCWTRKYSRILSWRKFQRVRAVGFSPSVTSRLVRAITILASSIISSSSPKSLGGMES
jgi:hypothetical protein